MTKSKKKWKKPQLIIFVSLPVSERALLATCVSGGGNPMGGQGCYVGTPTPGCQTCSS